jgi:MFS family permease
VNRRAEARTSAYDQAMPDAAARVQRTYLVLTLVSTLAASFIWGVNTLFLLDAGLNNTEAFTANAFFTAGQVLFEVPTGVVADTWGRRTSYLLGSATLLVSTLMYLAMWHLRAPLWAWGIASMALGLGFTFFSGATEAWLVDALSITGARQQLDRVFARGQIVSGVAMLTGTAAGGFAAQYGNLGVPYVIRAALLGLTFVVAATSMKDLGFTPVRNRGVRHEVRAVLRASIDSGWRNPPVRYLMLAGLCTGGIGIYAFYAVQPFLLKLYGDDQAFGVAGVAAAIVSASQILSGLSAAWLRRLVRRRTHVLILSALLIAASLAALGAITNFAVAMGVVVVWSFAFWAAMPTRQTYLNALIPSAQRATVLSFDNLMNSAGGVIAQPALGRAADVWGYAFTYTICALLQLTALPFLMLARRQNAAPDVIAPDDPT